MYSRSLELAMWPKDKCVFCEMETYTRGHHILPKCKGGKITMPTCITCEDFIHSTWSHNELDDMRYMVSTIYEVVDVIRNHEKFKKFLKWRLKQPTETVFKSERGQTRNRNKYS